MIAGDSRPDYKSGYFSSSDACNESWTYSGRTQNPNTIATQTISMTVPATGTTTTANAMSGGVVGMALNGVSIYSNAAAPGDQIYAEISTFDKCSAHPDSNSRYHYHSQPESISNADYNFIGVMRDGFPVYGYKDYATGTTATGLDSAGGHTGTTVDSPSTAVYHYHANLQTGTGTYASTSAYFLTTGYYAGTAGSCTGCQ